MADKMRKLPVISVSISKMIIISLMMIFMPVLSACSIDDLKNFFTIGAVKSVKSDNLEELEKKVKEYESNAGKKEVSGDKLAILYQDIGDKYLERKTWTSAIKAYEKAIGYGRDSSVIHYSIAVAYANRGSELQKDADFDKAEFHYKRAIEISPDYYHARYGLGILYAYARNDKARGLEIMKDLAARDRNYFNARFALGRIYYELGEKRKSLSVYEDLNSDLQKQKKSPQIEEYQRNCKLNIERLMSELAGK